MSTVPPYTVRVDGRGRRVEGAASTESLLFVLRERLGVRAVKDGCVTGDCGACSALLDGTLVNCCLVLAAAAAGREITTAAGLARGAPSDVPRAFAEAGAVQCGFCTPGLVLAAYELLERDAQPGDGQIREALSGNRCGCAGYGRAVEAVRRVVAERSR